MHEITITTIEIFARHTNADNAINMKRYMKDKFEFYGIKQPLRKVLQKQIFASISTLSFVELETISKELWIQPQRELQLVVIDLLDKYKNKAPANFIDLYEYLILTKSWWDTVDLIATKMVGALALKHPELIDSKINSWSFNKNIWLKRSALLYQLRYKKLTNSTLLEIYINQSKSTTEFFLNKAIGWVLREYSKTNDMWVRKFLKTYKSSLSNLSIKEASKYL